jgi:hypothetical protein
MKLQQFNMNEQRFRIELPSGSKPTIGSIARLDTDRQDCRAVKRLVEHCGQSTPMRKIALQRPSVSPRSAESEAS